MYLSALRFALLFAFISASASFYLDFTDELPVYLSDDSLVSKISRRSINEDEAEGTALPQVDSINSERDGKNGRQQTNGRDNTRLRRSIRDKKPEKLDLAESSLVFLPSFRRKAFRRLRRDTNNKESTTTNKPDKQKTTETVSSTTIKSGDTTTPKHETQDEQESGLVFLPSFNRKSKRSISKRDISTEEKRKNTDNKPEIESKNASDETEDVEESGLVFLPSFGRRSRRNVAPESTSSNKDIKEQNQQSKQTEIEDAQESGLVFLPSFGRRTRRTLTKRDASLSETGKNQNNKPKIEPKEPIDETEEVQESGLVFLPSFGRRSRRATSTQQKTPEKQDEDVSVANEQSKFESQDGQESGLVFLPSFGRRNRRHVEKRESLLKNNDAYPNKEKPPQSKESQETEEEQESGLVFLPSFGRRTRRNTNDESKEKQKQKTEPVTTEKANVKNEKKSDESEDVQESGLVFLPSFGRRNRRDNARN